MSVSIKDKNTTSSFRRLLIVQVTSSLISLAGSLIDGVIISRFLGEVNMAAYGLSNPAVILMVSCAFIFAAGSAAICGGYMGRGETQEVNRIMNVVIRTALLVALAFNLLISLMPMQIAGLLGAEGEVLPACADYLQTFAFGSYGVILTPPLVGFLQMDRDGKRILRSSVTFVICSTALDLLNVLVLQWGMSGMGLTTAVSYWVSISILFLHFRKKDSRLKLSRQSFLFKGIGRVFRIGFPAATFHLSNFVKILATNLIVLSVGGTAGLFANTVMHSLNPLIVGFFNGVGSTTLLLCSVIVGEGNRRSLHYTLKYILRLAFCSGLVMMLVMFFISKWFLAGFFCVGNAAVNRDAVISMLRIYCLSFPFTIWNMVMINYFQSMKRASIANMICIMDNVVYLISIMLLFSGWFGISGVWLSFAGAEALMLLTLYVYVWAKTKRLPRSLHDLMLVPDAFGVDVNRRINLTITSPEEAAGIHGRLMEFCRNLGVEPRKADAACLCIEELTGYIIEANRDALAGNSARSSRKEVYVDLYMTYAEGHMKLRVRDNGIPIDVSILNPAFDRENPEANLGMKIVYGMAECVNYSVILGMNVFSIEL